MRTIKIKKFKKGLALALVACLSVSGAPTNVADAATKKPKKITIANKEVVKNKVTMEKGAKMTLKIKVTPSGASKAVTYKSSNKKIAKVTSKGVVKALKKGTCKITIKSKKKKSIKRVLTVKVINASKNVAKVTPKPVATNVPTATPYVPVTTPTAEPPVTNINGQAIVMKSASINSTDFTISVKAELADGTRLDSLVPASVKQILSATSLKMTKDSTSFVAAFDSYSFDTNTIKYKLNEVDIAKLQPSKNGQTVGSADGEYTLSSEQMNGTVKISYYENLVGNSITGYVYDEATGLPLKGAKVTAYTSDSEKSATTNEDGYYKLPLTSASYKVRVENAGDTKYFSQETTGKVSNNNNTGCNFELSEYNENQMFLTGTVKSAKTSQDLSGAKVKLYKVTESGTKLMGQTTTGKSGAFAFLNVSATGTSEYKAFIKSVGTVSAYSFAKDKGLTAGGTYKIVVSKTVENAPLDAHKEKEISNIQFGYTKEKSLSQVVLEGVSETKEMNVQVKWADKLPTVKGGTVKLSVGVYHRDDEDKIANPIKTGTVEFAVDSENKITENVDLIAKGFFGGKVTLPSGRYYVGIHDDGTENAFMWQAVNVEEGGKVEVNPITVVTAKTVTVNANCNVLNENSIKGCTAGAAVNTVIDTDGNYTKGGVNAKYTLYEVIDGDKLVVSENTVSSPFVYKTSPTVSITADTTVGWVASGHKYVMSLDKSLVRTENTDLEFEQGNSVISTQEYKLTGAADVRKVKVNSAELFTSADGNLNASDVVKLEYVSLVDSTGKEVGRYDLTTTDDGFKKYTVSDVLSGISIPKKVDDAETGFYGIVPSDIKAKTGGYQLKVKFKGYAEATTDFFCIDFQNVTVTYTKPLNYIQETGITGSITIEGYDIQDTKDSTIDASIMLIDSNKEIVGFDTYGNKALDGKLIRKYELMNNDDSVITGGKYTLVVRCASHGDSKSFDTYVKEVELPTGKLTKLDITVSAGNNGSVMLGITDDKNNELESSNVYLLDQYAYGREDIKLHKDFPAVGDLNASSDELLGLYVVPVSKSNKTEFTRTETLPKGTFEVWVNSEGTGTEKIHSFTISSGQNYVKTGLKANLTAGDGKIPVTVKYTKNSEITNPGAFDVITIEDESGKVVVMKVNSNDDYTVGKTEIHTVNIPNVPGTYRVVIYSNGSFLSKDTITVQGVSKDITITLVKAAVN